MTTRKTKKNQDILNQIDRLNRHTFIILVWRKRVVI